MRREAPKDASGGGRIGRRMGVERASRAPPLAADRRRLLREAEADSKRSPALAPRAAAELYNRPQDGADAAVRKTALEQCVAAYPTVRLDQNDGGGGLEVGLDFARAHDENVVAGVGMNPLRANGHPSLVWPLLQSWPPGTQPIDAGDALLSSRARINRLTSDATGLGGGLIKRIFVGLPKRPDALGGARHHGGFVALEGIAGVEAFDRQLHPRLRAGLARHP